MDLVLFKRKLKQSQATSCVDCRGIVKERVNFKSLDFSFPIG